MKLRADHGIGTRQEPFEVVVLFALVPVFEELLELVAAGVVVTALVVAAAVVAAFVAADVAAEVVPETLLVPLTIGVGVKVLVAALVAAAVVAALVVAADGVEVVLWLLVTLLLALVPLELFVLKLPLEFRSTYSIRPVFTFKTRSATDPRLLPFWSFTWIWLTLVR